MYNTCKFDRNNSSIRSIYIVNIQNKNNRRNNGRRMTQTNGNFMKVVNEMNVRLNCNDMHF